MRKHPGVRPKPTLEVLMFNILSRKKKCIKCGVWKARSEFHKNKQRKDGLRPECKDCHCEDVREWKHNNSENVRENNRDWAYRNPGKVREFKRKWTVSNPEKVREIGRKSYWKNPEKKRQKSKRWRDANPDKVLSWYHDDKDRKKEVQRQYRISHPEKGRGRFKRWLLGNPGKLREYDQNRRALKKGNGGKITSEEWTMLMEKYGYKCLCCGRNDVKLTLDHIVPLVKGGLNTIDNAQPLCGSCNSSKGTKIIDYRP